MFILQFVKKFILLSRYFVMYFKYVFSNEYVVVSYTCTYVNILRSCTSQFVNYFSVNQKLMFFLYISNLCVISYFNFVKY